MEDWEEGKRERKGVGGRGKESGKEGGHSLIFTWIDATGIIISSAQLLGYDSER